MIIIIIIIIVIIIIIIVIILIFLMPFPIRRCQKGVYVLFYINFTSLAFSKGLELRFSQSFANVIFLKFVGRHESMRKSGPYGNNNNLLLNSAFVGYEEFCRSKRVLTPSFIIHSNYFPVLKGILPFRSFIFCSPKITQPRPEIFSINSSTTCSGLHFWRHFDVTGSIWQRSFQI